MQHINEYSLKKYFVSDFPRNNVIFDHEFNVLILDLGRVT